MRQVLLVEDEPALQDLFEMVLGKCGFEMVRVTSVDAFRLQFLHPLVDAVQAVIIDAMTLRGDDRRLAEVVGLYANRPVLVLTNQHLEVNLNDLVNETRNEARPTTANRRVVPTPFTWQELKQALNQVLGDVTT